MDVVQQLEGARESYRQQAWADAYEQFSAVDELAPLDAEDVERWAESADMLSRGHDSVRILQRAYQMHLAGNRIGDAIRCGYWLGQALLFSGEFAQSAGWLARGQRLAEAHPDFPEVGYLLINEAEQREREGDLEAAVVAARRAEELGRASGDGDLITLATRIKGCARIKQGRLTEGLALLDEAMLSVAAHETSARVVGWTYCAAISTCHELHEVRRAREWTMALNAWADESPQLRGLYSGICRVHRVQLLSLSGAWPYAAREAETACSELTQGYGEGAAGGAFYELGEIARLRGQLAQAEAAYRRTSEYGWQPQPGLALLWLARGKPDAAAAAVRRALGETTHRLARSQLLPAYVEIMLALGELAAARTAAAELVALADEYGTPALRAKAAHALGASELADGNAEKALPLLRQAFALWRELDAPYEAARVRVLIAAACRALGDDESCGMELDAARAVFEQLGAAPDLAKIDESIGTAHGDGSGLTPREAEVLRLVAAGKSNHAIAEELFLSDKTVHRHVSNIFTKLGVGSRTAAAAYAFEHGIVGAVGQHPVTTR